MESLHRFLKNKNEDINDAVEKVIEYLKNIFESDLTRVGDDHDLRSEIYLFALEHRETLSKYEKPLEILKLSMVNYFRKILKGYRAGIIEAERKTMGNHTEFINMYELNPNLNWVVAISAQYAYEGFFKDFTDEEKNAIQDTLSSSKTLDITKLIKTGAFGEKLSSKIEAAARRFTLPSEVLNHIFTVFIIHRLRSNKHE